MPDEPDLREEPIIDAVMTPPFQEILRVKKEAMLIKEEDIEISEKKRKPSTPDPVPGKELAKKMLSSDGKKTP